MAPLVLTPHDSALFVMKRDAVLAATPRHAQARAATSSCETFISLITASGRPAQRPPSRMSSSGWCSPTRAPLLPLLPSISTYVVWALQRA